jgi:hypothetical protein
MMIILPAGHGRDGHKGETMKNQGKICFVGVLALLLILSAAAQAEMYVEGFLGGSTAGDLGRANFHQFEPPPAATPTPPTPPPPPPYIPPNNGIDHALTSNLYLSSTGTVCPALVGGGRVGYWFVPEGFLGYNYPKWMKYFGVYTDVSYQQLKVSEQGIAVRDFNDAGFSVGTFPGKFSSNGYVVTWAFMFAARYGLFPDDKVPFGRFQPWMAVGPAILFTGMNPRTTVYNSSGGVGAVSSPGSKSVVTPALVVDAGIRYMIFKNLSVDLSFRYRYARPGFNFEFTDIYGVGSKFNFSPVYNLFSGMAGVAYHF